MSQPNHWLVAVAALLAAGIVSGPRARGADDGTIGIITTVAGSGEKSYSGDGGPATRASLRLPHGVAVGADGSLYIADTWNRRVRKVDPAGVISGVAGSDRKTRDGGDGGPATSASLGLPYDVAVGSDGSLYVADRRHHRVRKISAAGVITTVAGSGPGAAEGGSYSGDGGPATEAGLNGPRSVAVGPDGSLYIADTGNHRIRKVAPAGIITTIAGNGQQGFSGDGGPAAQASLDTPGDVALAPDGALYIADKSNFRVRRVDPAGIITTFAGSGQRGYSGDGGPATRASLCHPEAIALGPDGSLYIADTCKYVVRKVDPAGIITTVAGIGGTWGYWGDGGPATEAALGFPGGLAVDAKGTVYVADVWSGRIRRVRQWPCDPIQAKPLVDALRAKAGESPDAWREVASLYLIAKAWDDALAAAERSLALTPETEDAARMRAEVVAARAYAGKRDDHEAKRRLMRTLGRATDPTTLREAAAALVNLYVVLGERGQAIATLGDLRLRTRDRNLRAWIEHRLDELTDRETP